MTKVTVKVPEIRFRKEKMEVPVGRAEAIKGALLAQQERVSARLQKRNDEIARQLDKAAQKQAGGGRGKAFLTLGIGAAVGTAAGLLLAPSTGKAARAKVAQGGGKLARTASKQSQSRAKTFSSQASGKAAAARAKVQGSRTEEVDLEPETITARVQTELGENRQLRHLPRLNVNTEPGGVVYLRGVLPTEKDRERAEKIARKQTGVTEVINEVSISAEGAGSSEQPSDSVQ